MQRGFKTYANSLAEETRRDMELRSTDRLDPWELAKLLAIPVWPLSELRDQASDAVAHLTTQEPEAFSGLTVFTGSRRAIVYNDTHVDGRQASEIAHELAHGLLQHPPTAAMNDHGCRLWNQDIEDEARFLAGALLVTDDATLWIVRQGMSFDLAGAHFGATAKMIQYRVNVTGAKTRVDRARRYRRGR